MPVVLIVIAVLSVGLVWLFAFGLCYAAARGDEATERWQLPARTVSSRAVFAGA